MPPCDKSRSLQLLVTLSSTTDIDPESMDYHNISNFSADVSGMAVSSEEEISEDGGDQPHPNRKHIVYQSSLAELVNKVSKDIYMF